MSTEPASGQIQFSNGSRPSLAAVEVPEFSATRTVMPGAVRVALAGELDLATVAIAERELRLAQDDARDVQLDLRALTFIGAAGLRMVMAADLRAGQDGGRLAVRCQGSRCVRRLFDLTQADRSLDVVDDPAGAPTNGNGAGPSAT